MPEVNLIKLIAIVELEMIVEKEQKYLRTFRCYTITSKCLNDAKTVKKGNVKLFIFLRHKLSLEMMIFISVLTFHVMGNARPINGEQIHFQKNGNARIEKSAYHCSQLVSDLKRQKISCESVQWKWLVGHSFAKNGILIGENSSNTGFPRYSREVTFQKIWIFEYQNLPFRLNFMTFHSVLK